MALGAVVGAALNTAAVRVKGLYLDGLDVIKEPATPARYGVPIESIDLTETAAGSISSMTFLIEDTGLVVDVADGMEVRFHDIARDEPLFTGYLDSFSIRPMEGDQGRYIEVTCVGVEAMLDWALLPADQTFAADVPVQVAAQSIVASVIGLRELRALCANVGGSSQANPVGGNLVSGWNLGSVVTVPQGTSMREALRLVMAQVPGTALEPVWVATVDFWRGLRVYRQGTNGVSATDYASFSISNTPGGFKQTTDLNYALDAGQARGVFIIGGNAAGTGLVTDGSGKAGPISAFTDTDIDTAAKLAAAGAAYLADYTAALRGSYRWVDRVPESLVRPGSSVTITDARAGLTSAQFRIGSISKTFNPSGRENWTVYFGGTIPSMTSLARRLTKDARA